MVKISYFIKIMLIINYLKIILLFLLTFICSAIWHGFYKCYYYFFISFYFLQQSSEILNKCGFYNQLKQSNFIFKIIFSIIIQSIVNSVSSIFFILKEDIVNIYLKNVYYFPFISVLFLYLFSQSMKIKNNNKKKIN